MIRFQKKDGSIVEVENDKVEAFKIEFPEAIVIEPEKKIAEEIKNKKPISHEYISKDNTIVEQNKQKVNKIQRAIKFSNDLKYGKRDNFKQWKDVDIVLDETVDDDMGSTNIETIEDNLLVKVKNLYDKLDLVDITEGVITDVFENLQNLDIVNENNIYAGSYSDFDSKLQDEIRNTAWLKTREESGMNITIQLKWEGPDGGA